MVAGSRDSQGPGPRRPSDAAAGGLSLGVPAVVPGIDAAAGGLSLGGRAVVPGNFHHSGQPSRLPTGLFGLETEYPSRAKRWVANGGNFGPRSGPGVHRHLDGAISIIPARLAPGTQEFAAWGDEIHRQRTAASPNAGNCPPVCYLAPISATNAWLRRLRSSSAARLRSASLPGPRLSRISCISSRDIDGTPKACIARRQ